MARVATLESLQAQSERVLRGDFDTFPGDNAWRKQKDLSRLELIKLDQVWTRRTTDPLTDPSTDGARSFQHKAPFVHQIVESVESFSSLQHLPLSILDDKTQRL